MQKKHLQKILYFGSSYMIIWVAISPYTWSNSEENEFWFFFVILSMHPRGTLNLFPYICRSVENSTSAPCQGVNSPPIGRAWMLAGFSKQSQQTNNCLTNDKYVTGQQFIWQNRTTWKLNLQNEPPLPMLVLCHIATSPQTGDFMIRTNKWCKQRNKQH